MTTLTEILLLYKVTHLKAIQQYCFSCIFSFWALVFAFSISQSIMGQSAGQPSVIIISNHASFSRLNEIISIKRDSLREKANTFFPLTRKGRQFLPEQIVDTNKDGIWDELLIEVNLPAKSNDTLELRWVPKTEIVKFKKSTNVRFSLNSKTGNSSPEIESRVRIRDFIQDISDPVFQMEGPGIENDKVAFRSFFDKRNGKDTYGKTTTELVLESVGLSGTWHELQDWGMDILKVGNSLGAGALAVKEKDSLYRLADADTSVFISLYEGPLQASFQLKFIGWDAGTTQKNGSETITLSKADFFYKNEITLALNNNQHLVSGIAHFSEDSANYFHHNDAFSSLSTYGNQAEGTGTKLGLAIMFPTENYIGNTSTTTTDAISNTCYVEMKSQRTKKLIYFFACWEKTDKRFSTKQGFENYLQQTADRLANPIQVQIVHDKN